ncbi:MAG: AI-2E family transporter [Burkholderiaceae bacterium]
MILEDLAEAKWLKRLIVAALLAALVLLSVMILDNFVVTVIWAAILAYVCWPLNQRVVMVMKGRRSVAALIMTLLLSAAIILPIVWFVFLVRSEAMPLIREIGPLLTRFQLPDFVGQIPYLGPKIVEFVAELERDPNLINAEIRDLLDQYSGQMTDIMGGVGRNIVKLGLSMVTLYFMFVEGERLAAQVTRMLQQFFGDERVKHYMDAIGSTVKGVVYGIVLAALAQGTLAGIGYWVSGLPAPLLFAVLTFMVGLIPFVVPFMWIGASLWLLLTGQTVAAIGLFLWGATAVSWIDNIVRPLVISGASRIPFLLVLFGVLGGLAAFGLVGLFIGPVILAVLMAIWREWLSEKRAAAEEVEQHDIHPA